MKILVAPLDWGLGHATRCIPVIKGLIRQGHDVLIAADGKVEKLLKKEFPELTFVFLRGYRVRYSSFLPMTFSMILQIPKITRRIFMEHGELKKIIRKYHIDMIVSDNRYGLWNKEIHSVFITHQVMIKFPSVLRFLEPVLYRINKFFISKFDECHIPDDERKLSGDLAHHYPLPANAKFIGALSRWKDEKGEPAEKKYDVIGIVSGPEPHRASFEKLLTRQFLESNLDALIVSGKPGEKGEKRISGRLLTVPHLESGKLLTAVTSSTFVICRAGYSSIMDFAAIGKDAIFVPTPGQTEQIYLAEYLREKKSFYSVEQKRFQLKEALSESKKYSVKNLAGEKNILNRPVTPYELLLQE